jgi:DNA-binding NtrC family response regulator
MEQTKETILVVDDDPFIQEGLEDRLSALGYRIFVVGDGKAALEMIGRQTPQLAFLDIEMPKMKGIEVLREIRRRELDFPVVMITAYGSIDLAVDAMKEGAFDFIAKPFEGSHVALVVAKALEQRRLKQNITLLTEEVDKRHQLIAGTSDRMNRAIGAAKKSAASPSTVLLLGESGVGKELFARAIHNWSERRNRPFVAINCVGLSKDLLESELFGYERGAFTGAQQRKKGKIELADGGTVFLDEIGDISEALQTKLLRFLQEREFERVGGTELIQVDVRIIAATNRDLQAAVKEGCFREDLYYRINVVPLALPPLRERKEDIPELARHFIQRCATQSKRHFTELSEDAMKRLLGYDWPGNVRELANVIERAIVLGQPPTIQVDDLPIEISATPLQRSTSAQLNYHESIDEHRREVVVKALQQSNGNRTLAAKQLGLERAYFQKLMKSLGIS